VDAVWVLLIFLLLGLLFALPFLSLWREQRRRAQEAARELAALRALDDDALAAQVRALLPYIWLEGPPARVVERMAPLTGWTPRALQDAIQRLRDATHDEDDSGVNFECDALLLPISTVVNERVRQQQVREAKGG
jgi:biopolymer transport protein ExbB/TolQ